MGLSGIFTKAPSPGPDQASLKVGCGKLPLRGRRFQQDARISAPANCQFAVRINSGRASLTASIRQTPGAGDPVNQELGGWSAVMRFIEQNERIQMREQNAERRAVAGAG